MGTSISCGIPRPSPTCTFLLSPCPSPYPEFRTSFDLSFFLAVEFLQLHPFLGLHANIAVPITFSEMQRKVGILSLLNVAANEQMEIKVWEVFCRVFPKGRLSWTWPRHTGIPAYRSTWFNAAHNSPTWRDHFGWFLESQTPIYSKRTSSSYRWRVANGWANGLELGFLYQLYQLGRCVWSLEGLSTQFWNNEQPLESLSA